ncbi:signal peptidase II [Brevibacterium jeotgali]|uniref:Lipoprotein signal peptidase n=1 Tax=Brevibacterium jeotgali TaxID=1262550 RepID=A0A2H1L6P9_9MICO|nr:signal peptidase II [Brevibacterium jeotgali]TWC02661.1 signal peptidase II [Brevibacterium jeotgali]SMY12571.1 signal peptidase II [Brevibacterium jeotgali]
MTLGSARTDVPAGGRALRVVLCAVAATVIVVDQATKQIAVALLEGEPRVPVLGEWAGFLFHRNDGAAFGMGANATWVFTVIALVVFVAILWAGRRLGSRAWAWALGLLLGGLTGNLIDRLARPPEFFHGAVVDFIDLYFFVCNVADIAITGAAALLILASFRGIGLDGRLESEREAERNAENTASAALADADRGPGPVGEAGAGEDEEESTR